MICQPSETWYNAACHATLAQSAEQPLRKWQVLGSIPKGGSSRGPRYGAFFLGMDLAERMNARTPRNTWRVIWQLATGDLVLVVLLMGVAISLTIAAWLPQTPTSDPVEYARWFSNVQARYGDWAVRLRTIGLFSILRSVFFRLTLALSFGVLFVRTVDRADRFWRSRELSDADRDWRPLATGDLSSLVDALRDRRFRVRKVSSLYQIDRWPWGTLLPLLALVGGLVLLTGIATDAAGGWQLEDVVVQRGKRVQLRQGTAWVDVDESGAISRSQGIVTSVEARGPGVRARAETEDGTPLSLHQTVEGPSALQIELPLDEDRYFAIPDVQLVIRLIREPQQSGAAENPIRVQAYRSPPGRLIEEIVIDGGGVLEIDGVQLELDPVPYVSLSVVHNPGRWLLFFGVALCTIGMMGRVVFPQQRFWLREGDGGVEAAGELPPQLAVVEEAE